MSAVFKARAWVFTINNHQFSDLLYVMDLPYRYFCFGFEICPKTKTPHIQGYVYFDSARTKKGVSKLLPRAFIELAKGTTAENDKYTSKLGDDDWYHDGDPPHQGEAKWDQIVEVMKDPRMQPQVANQYRKLYRELTYCKKKDHERELIFLPYLRRYEYARNHTYEDTYFMKEYVYDNYNAQTYMITDCGKHFDFPIEDWFNGFPPTVKRGYELIVVDPRVIYITYADQSDLTYISD